MKSLMNYSILLTVLMLSGCSLFSDGGNDDIIDLPNDDNILVRHDHNTGAAIEGAPIDSEVELVLNFHTHQMVEDFTDRLAYGLMKNIRHTPWQGDVLVASFVNFDDTLKESNALGNLISENLIGDMQGYDVPVVDIHMRGWLEINNTGSYVFTRDGDEIPFNENIKYVLSGVMIRVERGVKINGRIVELASQKVISTASVLIPNYLIDSL